LGSCQKIKPFGIKGKGTVISEVRNLQGFNEIELDIDARVEFRQDSVYYVEVQAQSNLLPHLRTKIKDGEMEIDFDCWVRNHEEITIIIHAPDIQKLEINGSGTIAALTPIQSSHLSTEISGSGSILLQEVQIGTYDSDISGSGKIEIGGGTVDNGEIEISGSGEQDMLAVQFKTANIEISGSGEVRLSCSDYMNVEISGSGTVYYSGNASVNTSISGSGELIKL
jgi:hypothetical protein